MEVKSEFTHHEDDEPKKSIKDDKLNVKERVKKTVELIINSLNSLLDPEKSREGSYSIAILGQWGSGKTTFINFVREELLRDTNLPKNLEIKDFNPWFFSSTDNELKRHFIALVSNTKNLLCPLILPLLAYVTILLLTTFLSENINIFFLTHPKVYLFLSLFQGTAIPTFFFFILYYFIYHRDSLQKVTTLIKLTLSIIGKGDLSNILDGEDAYDAVKAQDQLKKMMGDKKLLIIIDDIDRLHEHEIKKLFDLLKTIGNLPNIIYLLCFDHGVVSQALNKDDVNQGSKYLEKFIQHPVTLLPSHAELLINEIKDILKSSRIQSFSLENGSFLLPKYITTMRGVKRLVRTLKYNTDLDYNNINPLHLLYITAIGLQQYMIYTLIWNSKEFLCSRQRGQDEFIDLKADFMSELEKFNPSLICRKMLYKLFPIIQDKPFVSPSGDQDIDHPDYFDIYFNLSFPDDLVCDEEFKSMLDVQSDPDTLHQTLSDLINSGAEKEKQKMTTRLTNPFKWLYNLSSRLLTISHKTRYQEHRQLNSQNWLLALARIAECLLAQSTSPYQRENDFFNDLDNLFWTLNSDSELVSLENSNPKPPIYAFLRIYLKIMNSKTYGNDLELKKQKLKNIVIKNIEKYSKNEKVFELFYWKDIISLTNNDSVAAKSVVNIIKTEINQDHRALLKLIKWNVEYDPTFVNLIKYISLAEVNTKLEAMRLMPEFREKDEEISSYIKSLSSN